MSGNRTWLALAEVCDEYGLTIESARNAVQRGTFPVPTYKLGRNIVVDRAVHEEFFKRKREEGLRALENNIKRLSQQRSGRDA